MLNARFQRLSAFIGWVFLIFGAAALGSFRSAWAGGAGALLVRPEQPWAEGLFAALPKSLDGQEIPFALATEAALDDLPQLVKYDLVALSVRRMLSERQAANLKEYVSRGGALYASWGGPYGNEDALKFSREVFRAEGQQPSIYIREVFPVPGSPIITPGLATKLEFRGEKPAENVELRPLPGATLLLRDGQGRCLGVSFEYGQGRAILLGVCLETGGLAPRDSSDDLMANVYRWLLRGRAPWNNGIVDIALPARAKVLTVSAGGKPVSDYAVREVGSLKRVRFRTAVAEGQREQIRIEYEPLSKARNVECIAHFPSGSIERTHSPAALAELMKMMNVTVFLPHVHGAYDECVYNGLPEDRKRFEDPAQAQEKYGMSYKSDFLAELIAECHKREIKVYASLYLGCRLAREKCPETIVVNQDGTRDQKNWACFNNPRTMEHNWAMLRHLLDNYKFDGLIYDDNFGLNCYCDFCKRGFKAYCEGKGWAHVDPSKIAASGDDAQHWLEYRRSVVHALAAKLGQIVRDTRRPVGAWIGAGLSNDHFAFTTETMSRCFDFLGAMIYTGYSPYARPRRDTQVMAKLLGPCQIFSLLWAPNKKPEEFAPEVYEAIAGGCDATGFWCLAENQVVKDWWMEEGSFQAIGRALADVENIWLGCYQRNILHGDRRLAVLSGRVGKDALELELANIGDQPPASPPPKANLDLTGVIEATIGYNSGRGILAEPPSRAK